MHRFKSIAGLLVAGFVLALALPAQSQNGGTSVSAIESLIRSHQYDQALESLKTALHQSPADYKLWTLRGICLALEGNNPGAITAFDRALAISPNYTPALKSEVQILYQTGDRRAVPLLERMLKTDPSDTTGHEMLAMLEARAGDCQSAVSQFLLSKSALGDHPTSLEAYGYCLFKLGRTVDAIPVFRQLIPLLAGQAYPSYDLAVLLVATREYQEAIQVLQPFLTPDQTDADILSLASQAYEATGKTPEAVTLQRQAIVANPTDPANYVRFAVLCLTHDSFQVGIDMLNAGLKHIHDNASLYLSRGVLDIQIGEFEKAEADFKMAEQLDSSHTVAAYAGDLAIIQRNNPNVALAKVRQQLKAHPRDPLLHLLTAKLIMMDGPDPHSPAFKEAMQNAAAAAEIKPDLVDAHSELASMYMSLGQYDRAVKECRTALQYDPSNETALYHLIISLRHTGHEEDLKPMVRRLAELHKESLQRETDRKRFRLVEAPTPPAPSAAGH